MTEQRQRREISAIIRAPTKEQLDKMLLKMERYSARTDMQPIDVHSLREVPGGWEAVVTAHNWNPTKWFKEQTHKVGEHLEKRREKRAAKKFEKAVFGTEARTLKAGERTAVHELVGEATAKRVKAEKGLTEAVLSRRAQDRQIQELERKRQVPIGELSHLHPRRLLHEAGAAAKGEAEKRMEELWMSRKATREERVSAAAQQRMLQEAGHKRTEAMQRRMTGITEKERGRAATETFRKRLGTARRIKTIADFAAEEGFEGISVKPITKRMIEHGVVDVAGAQPGRIFFGEPAKYVPPIVPVVGRGLARQQTIFTPQQQGLILNRFKQKYPTAYRDVYEFAATRSMKARPEFQDMYESAMVSGQTDKWQEIVSEVLGASGLSTGLGINLAEIVDIGSAAPAPRAKRKRVDKKAAEQWHTDMQQKAEQELSREVAKGFFEGGASKRVHERTS